MQRMIFLVLLTLSLLQSSESIFTDAKMAIKLIDKKNISFISLDDSRLKIKKSKQLDIKYLQSSNILGHQACSPFYLCSKELEKYFSALGINSNEPLILYDNTYGINAATLYVTLESMGHQNITILRANINELLHLDPNREKFNKYLNDFENLSTLLSKENNKTIISEKNSELIVLKEKVKILKKHLLLEEYEYKEEKILKSHYKVLKKNSNFLLSKFSLEKAVQSVQNKEKNLRIIDVCPMVDIVGNHRGSYVSGVMPLSWKRMVNKNTKYLKSKKVLNELFREIGLDKEQNNYLYCMSGAEKAFFVMMALREAGFTKVKAFTGDWNVWTGDLDE